MASWSLGFSMDGSTAEPSVKWRKIKNAAGRDKRGDRRLLRLSHLGGLVPVTDGGERQRTAAGFVARRHGMGLGDALRMGKGAMRQTPGRQTASGQAAQCI